MKVTIIDPPSGWRYGFPKVYNNPDNIPLKQWLINNGYPEREIIGDGKYCRFWDQELED